MNFMKEAWLEELSSWLQNAGYERFDEKFEGFGDLRIRFVGRACQVVVGREKLQWYICLAPRGGDPVMLPRIWQGYLDGIDPDPESPASLESNLSFVYDRLEEVASAAECDTEIGQKLRAINRKVILARLRLGPDLRRLD
jgi:hypothetical protein